MICSSRQSAHIFLQRCSLTSLGRLTGIVYVSMSVRQIEEGRRDQGDGEGNRRLGQQRFSQSHIISNTLFNPVVFRSCVISSLIMFCRFNNYIHVANTPVAYCFRRAEHTYRFADTSLVVATYDRRVTPLFPSSSSFDGAAVKLTADINATLSQQER